MQRHDKLDAFAMALMLLLCATWGLNQVAAKVGNDSISPLLQAGLRSAGAAFLVWAWSAARGVNLFARDATWRPGIGAGLLFAVEFALIYRGLEFTDASRCVVFLYTAPFVVALGLHWLVPAERLGRWQVAGLICAFAGVVAAFSENLGLPAGRQWIGDAMILLAALLWGATTIIIRASGLAAAGAGKILFYQLAVSALVLPPAALALGEPGFTHPTAIGLVAFAWQTVVVAFASYLGWFWLIGRYPATRLSAFSFLTPIFGVGFGALLLGERVTPALGAGLALVACGLWLINRSAPASAERIADLPIRGRNA